MSKIVLPKIGLGTMTANTKKAKEGLIKGIQIGFRFVDTAQIYMNERVVGKAIKQSGVSRDEFVVATKLWVWNYSPNRVLKTAKKSLKRLDLDIIDIFYIHWPFRFSKVNKTLEAMNKLVDDEIIRYIAVSNYTTELVDKALALSKYHIVANQVEMHPWLQQKNLIEHHLKNNIHVISYFPLMHGRFNKVIELQDIAKKYNTSAAQICLAWIISKGVIPIPKSTSESHLQENFNSQNIKLTKDEINLIDSIKYQKRFLSPPIISPKWDK